MRIESKSVGFFDKLAVFNTGAPFAYRPDLADPLHLISLNELAVFEYDIQTQTLQLFNKHVK